MLGKLNKKKNGLAFFLRETKDSSRSRKTLRSEFALKKKIVQSPKKLSPLVRLTLGSFTTQVDPANISEQSPHNVFGSRCTSKCHFHGQIHPHDHRASYNYNSPEFQDQSRRRVFQIRIRPNRFPARVVSVWIITDGLADQESDAGAASYFGMWKNCAIGPPDPV